MALHCEHCAATFSTNAKLYTHKKKAHNTPSLLLLNHDHTNGSSTGKKRKASNDQPAGPPPAAVDHDPQLDDGLTIIDEINDDRNKKKKKLDPELDDDLKIIDEIGNDSDGQNDSDLTVVDEWTRPKDYKQLYEDCMEEGRNIKFNLKRLKDSLKSSFKLEMRNKLSEQRLRHESIVAELKKRHEKQMSDLESVKESLCTDELEKMRKSVTAARDDHEKEVQRLKETVKGLVQDADKMTKAHKLELDDLENQCQGKIKTLKEHIKALEEDDADFDPLVQAIFNCTSMEEIFKIQRLVDNHQLDLVIRDHLPTLRKLFLSLSHGVLPICQPQRDQITDQQKDLVEKIQTISRPSARKLLRDKRKDLVGLFSIIRESIKLARNSYNRYAINR